ncbi:hypothetical protein TEA_015916 [Camellia sinensis var. sinensis]|uniref:Pectinesterase inhibitor domain-containing protein n=1 Tax=Camellia sinensis var. sinensis TaxID=542762 RepID=A0A4S4E0D5_CAMSN|nr:hypothetical protein TEA_015916 [Camellia sinensis var. sinensis]
MDRDNIRFILSRTCVDHELSSIEELLFLASDLTESSSFQVLMLEHGHHHPGKPSEQPAKSQSTTHRAPVSFHQACKATRHPRTCEASLTPPPNHASSKTEDDPIRMLQCATRVSATNLHSAQIMIINIIDKAPNNQNLSKVVKTCTEVLRNAEYRMSLTVDALPRGEIKNARAWMSAALVYENGCMSGLNKTTNAFPWVNTTVSYLESLVNLTSDALSMMVSYDVFGNETQLWNPPRTERDGFWEDIGRSDSSGGFDLGFKGGFPSGLMTNVTVCKGMAKGEVCDYMTDLTTFKFLSRRHYHIFLLSSSRSIEGVLGDGFMAKDLTIENTAGPNAHQAVAFRSDSDLSIIENCEFIGNQDTVCANTLRQFYKSCRIQGNVDFIFGFSTSIFQDCLILVSPRPQVFPQNNVITAHGRFDPAQSTGFVFLNCTVNGTNEYMMTFYNKRNPSPKEVCKNFLGRPWKEYSRTIFIQCNLGDLIAPTGWMPWDGNFALSTLYYGEFDNFGHGSNLSFREKWSSTIPANHVQTYSVQNFIQGAKWIPTSSNSSYS